MMVEQEEVLADDGTHGIMRSKQLLLLKRGKGNNSAAGPHMCSGRSGYRSVAWLLITQ